MVDQQRLTDALVDLAASLTRDCRIQGLLDQIVEQLPKILPVVGAGVLLAGRHRELTHVAASDPTLLRLQRMQVEQAEGPCLDTFVSGQPVVVPDLPRDTRYPALGRSGAGAGVAAVSVFPMTVGRAPLGALAVYRSTPGALEPADAAAAQVVADVATAHVVNLRTRAAACDRAELLRQQALHDPLTGLPNRLLLHDRLQVAMAKARRSDCNVAVLFVDLDDFKVINDSYGHSAGDAMLVAVAERLRAVLRPGDTLARLGGDEFVVLCEDLTDCHMAEKLASRVAEALREPFVVNYGREPTHEITLTGSVGVAYAGEGAMMPEVLLRDADAAMYQAKRHGGARYVVTGDAVHRFVEPPDRSIRAAG